MKLEINTVYELPYLGFIKIILINKEKDLEIELRCTDFKCEDFKRRYEHFYKWLLDMRGVSMEVDTILIAFERFKSAEILSYEELAEKIYCAYHEGAEEE